MEKSEFIKVRGRNFHCQLCDIKITSEKAVDDHLTGKKHQRLLSLRDSRHEQAQRSIFVGGLSRLNGELELGDYFSQFGEVAQIIIDKDKAHYAIIEFASQESAQKAAEVEKQLMNGRKIVVRPRQPKTTKPQRAGASMPRSKQAGKAGSSKGKMSSPQKLQLEEALFQRLQQQETVSEQMSTLIQLTELTQADLRLRHLICDLLQTVLEEFLSGCRITPFGSSVNGFGVRGCDLDIHLELGESASRICETPADARSEGEEKQNQPGLADDQVTLDIASATPLDILSMVSDVIKRCVPSCHNVHTIPSARLPVVKFTHKESGLQCDISMNNRLALQNTKLLQFYSIQEQVRPLVFAVRHWAKLCQLAGNIGAGPRLTNYALTLMVLFYLQARDRPVIPSVAELECSGEGCGSVFSLSESFSTTENTDTQDDLLKGFFSFYNEFDFATTVICPLFGKTASLSEVLQSTEGCDDSGRSFKTGAVNIQDPFELWHNVALNVNDKTAEKLAAEFSTAAKLCQSGMMQGEKGSLEDKAWGLLAVLDSSSKPPSLPNSPSASTTGSTSDDIRLEINLKSSHLSQRFKAEHPDHSDLKSAWCDAVKRLAYRSLLEALKFDCRWLSRNQTETAANMVKDTESSHTTGKQDCSTQNISSNPVTLGTEDNHKAESNGLTGSAGLDSSVEGALCSDHTDKESGEPPPSKRCKVDTCEEDFQSSVSQKHTTGDSNKVAPTCTLSSKPWGPGSEILECTAYHQVWLGRRKARRQLLQSRHKPQEGSPTPAPATDAKQPSTDHVNSDPTPENPPEATNKLNSPPQEGMVAASSTSVCEKPIETTEPSQESSNISPATGYSNALQSQLRTCDSQPGSQLVHDYFLIESQVTDLIISGNLQGGQQTVPPILRFSLLLTDNLTKGTPSITMHFLPKFGDADFKTFLHFFDLYFKMMLDQCKI